MIQGDKIIFDGAAIKETGLEKPGKLIIKIEQQQHNVFERRDNNLHLVKTLKSKQNGYACHSTIDGRTLVTTNTGECPRQDIILGEGIPLYGRKPAGALIINYI